MRVEGLVSLARPLPRRGMGVHLSPLIFGFAALAAAGVGAYRRWSPAVQADSGPLLIDHLAGIALVVGLLLLPLATAGMLAARAVVPILFLVTVRGEARLVVTPYLWATRVRRTDTLTVGIDAGEYGGGSGTAMRAWIRTGRGEVSFPLARSAHTDIPDLVLHRPDLVTMP